MRCRQTLRRSRSPISPAALPALQLHKPEANSHDDPALTPSHLLFDAAASPADHLRGCKGARRRATHAHLNSASEASTHWRVSAEPSMGPARSRADVLPRRANTHQAAYVWPSTVIAALAVIPGGAHLNESPSTH
jgi:hypothetical protein